MRLYEIEGLPQFKFGGVKTSPLYTPCPAPPGRLHLNVRLPNVKCPGQFTVNSGVITPSSSAAVAMRILNADPGE